MVDIVLKPISKEFIEFLSLVDLIVDYRQPELKKLDSYNPLLAFEINKITGGIEYPPTFKKRFGGPPLSKALQNYRSILEAEIEKLKAKRN